MYEVNNGDYQADTYEELVQILAEEQVTHIDNFNVYGKGQSENTIIFLIYAIEDKIEEIKKNDDDWNGVQLSAQQSYDRRYD